MKILSAETNLASATSVNNSSVLRVFNSDSSNTMTVTRKTANGDTVGSFTVPSGKVTYCEKDYTDTIDGGANLKVSQVDFSPMMSFASFGEAGPTYSYSVSSSNVDEGGSFTTTITTTQVDDGTTLYWRLTGIASSDFTSGSLTGTGTVSSGGFSFSHTVTADVSTEGEEVIYIALYTDAGYTTLVAAANVVINDTSFDPVGESIYTEEGTFNWVCPANVTSICVVCVGSGSTWTTGNNGNQGSAAGGLGYKNNISVTPGQSYAVQVGGPNGTNSASYDPSSGYSSYIGPADSFFINTSTVKGGGGWTPPAPCICTSCQKYRTVTKKNYFCIGKLD